MIADLKTINEKEIKALKDKYRVKLDSSARLDMMPTVKVRPNLSVEVKHRVMNLRQSIGGASTGKKSTTNLMPEGKKPDEIALVTQRVVSAISNPVRQG